MNNTQWLPVLTIALLASAPALAQHDHGDHDHNGHDHEDHSDHNHDHSGHDHHDHGEHGDAPAGLSSEDRETLTGETLYTCAMHPQVRSDNPDDRCPICGMALVPVEEVEPDDGHDGHENGEAIRLSERALALANVATEPVERRSLTREMTLPGRVAVAEDQLHTLSARVSGRLDELHVRITGTEVESGQVVARIYSPELLAAQEELLQAVRLEARESERSARDKLRLLGIADRDIAELTERGEVRDHLPIRATRAGVVLERTVSEGEYVQTGQPLYRLAGLSKIWVQLEAFESELPYLSEGQHAHMTLTSGETYHGNIVFIDPVLDDNKRSAQLRLEVDNPERNLKPGMLVRGQVQLPDEPRLVIPAGAPLLTGERALVYVRQPGDTPGFALREVTLGPKAGDYYPVLEGLSEGEVVVSQGALRLDSERQIRGMASMMAPEGNGAPAHDHGDHENGDDHQDHDDHQGREEAHSHE